MLIGCTFLVQESLNLGLSQEKSPMEGQFTVQLFDILVYLGPGAISLAAIMVISGYKLGSSSDEAKGVRIALGLLAVFFLGVLAHIIAQFAYSGVRRVTGQSVLFWTLEQFDELPTITRIVKTRLGHEPRDSGETYRFAEVAVNQRAPAQAASVARLVALSLFCRNSIIPLAVLAYCFWRRWFRGKRRQTLALVAVLALSETVLVLAFIRYWSVAITKVVRTYTFIELFP